MGQIMIEEIQALCKMGGSNPLAAERALQQIGRMCVADADFSQGYQLHQPAPGCLVQPVVAPSRIVRVQPVQVLPASTAVAPSITMTGIGNASLVGWKGAAFDVATGALVAPNLMEVQLRINDNERLITDGEIEAFANFDVLFTGIPFYAPILRRLDVNDRLTITFQNLDPALTLQPILQFYFLADRDVRNDFNRIDCNRG